MQIIVKMRLCRKICPMYNALLKFFIVNLLLLICFADAESRQLRTSIDEGAIRREVQVLQPPPNDNCTGAIVIPTNFPGLTYTTKGVSIESATTSSGRPYHSCFLGGRTKDVWYQFTPSTARFYSFSTNQGHVQMVSFTDLYSTAATTCENARRIDCQAARPSVDLLLNANKTYFLFIQPAMRNVTGTLQLKVERGRPASNYLCTTATNIDPIGATSLVIDNPLYGIHDNTATLPFTSPCYTSIYFSTYWYKITNALATQISVHIHVDLAKRADYGASFAIFQGANCGTLRCVQGLNYGPTGSYDFIANPRESYFILVKPYSKGPFNVTINGQTQFFSIVNPNTGTAIQQLRDIHYYRFPASKINIHAHFPSLPDPPIRSVRMTYDSPKRIMCDQRVPYSVFGDIHGEHNNATLQLGRHKVTATPFALPNCTGKPGTSISQEFRVTGCATTFDLYDYSLTPSTSEIVSYGVSYKPTKLPVMISLPCKVYVYMFVACGFPLRTTTFELRDATTGELIFTDQEKLFGTLSGDTSYQILDDVHIAKGSYSLRAIINGVTHPSMNFTVVQSSCVP